MIRKNKSHDEEDCSQSKKHRSGVGNISTTVYYDDQSSAQSMSDRTIPTQTESNQSSPIRPNHHNNNHHNHNHLFNQQGSQLETEDLPPPAFQSSASTRSSIHSVNNASQSCNLNELGGVDSYPSNSSSSSSSADSNNNNSQKQQPPRKSSVASAWNRLGRSWGWFVSTD